MILARRWNLLRSLASAVRIHCSLPIISEISSQRTCYSTLCLKMVHSPAISSTANYNFLTIYDGSSLQGICDSHVSRRQKHTKSRKNKRKEENFSDDEDSDDDVLESGADFRDLKANVPSLRLDAILKAGLNMSRNKVEAVFYESRIRINGEKVMKKSKHLQEEDEIDIIKSKSNTNPDFLNISRVVLLNIGEYNEETNKIQVKLRRYPQLLVENYDDTYEQES